LLKTTTNPAERIAILNHSLEDIRGALIRQTMFAEFEKITHEKAEAGEALTAESLSAAYYELTKSYYGPEVTVDELINIEWARVPHFYRSFYVYQYATGISAATALVHGMLNEGEPAVERYLGFLRAGVSDYSIAVLQRAGVDMTSSEPIKQTFAMFESHLSQLEALVG
jgi:oligoendopeptidase F